MRPDFLGLGLNGYEFDKVKSIVELSGGLFVDMNSYEVKKTGNYLIYENGTCKKRK